MFGSLKKKLQEGIKKLSDKLAEPEKPVPYPPPREQPTPRPEPAPAKAFPPPVSPQPPSTPPQSLPRPPHQPRPASAPSLPQQSPLSVPSQPAAPEPTAFPVLKPEDGRKHSPAPEVPQPHLKPIPVPRASPPAPIPIPHVPAVPKPGAPEPEKRSFRDRIGFGKVVEKITERSLSGQDIDDFFRDAETGLLEANVALPVIDLMRADLKVQLANKPVKRAQAAAFISRAFRHALLQVVNQGPVSIPALAKTKKPLTVLMLGFNGAGKTTTIAKIAAHLTQQGLRVSLAAGDTFRAASIEQLGVHAERLKVPLIKSQYGADSAAVIFDARKHAQANRIDVVLADTAGRTHVDKNLIDELKKIVRVNQPDLKVLVIDSLTGNDAVEQARLFNEAVGVDAVVLTKLDVNTRGGAILSVCAAIRKPILYLGTGQGYEDLQEFVPERFADDLLEKE